MGLEDTPVLDKVTARLGQKMCTMHICFFDQFATLEWRVCGGVRADAGLEDTPVLDIR